MTPALLVQVDPATTAKLYLSKLWYLTQDEDEAHVFPSEVLARRHAIECRNKTGLTFMPVEAPQRQPTVSGHACRACGCTETFACPDGCVWAEADLCSACVEDKEHVSWVVYAPGEDYPEHYIARRFVDSIPTEIVVNADSVEALRRSHLGLMMVMPRMSVDAPRIVEFWT